MAKIDETIARIREQFPFYQEPANECWVYLDSGATALKPSSVLDAETAYNCAYTANIHRAVFDNSFKASDAYEKARSKVAGFLGASSPEEVFFTGGTTAGINLFARSYAQAFLTKGSRVVCTEMEHHANLIPWQEITAYCGCELVFAPLLDDGTLDLDAFERLLTPNTKLAAFTAVSNVLGTINPIEDMARLCQSKGIHTFVDAAQGILHHSFHLKESAIDFLAFSGHKVFGPTGVGVFYGRQSLLKRLPPFFYGGGMVQEVQLSKSTYAPPPARFEGGTPPIAQAIAMGAVVDYLQDLGRDTLMAVEEHNLRLGLEVFAKYKDKGVTLLGFAQKRAPIFSFSIDQVHPHDAGSFFNEERIAVRTGHQCAQPLLNRFGVSSVTRASAGIYNTSSDWRSFDQALSRLLDFFQVS